METPDMPVQISLFLQFCKKRKTAETILPVITQKYNLANFGCGGDMLKNL